MVVIELSEDSTIEFNAAVIMKAAEDVISPKKSILFDGKGDRWDSQKMAGKNQGEMFFSFIHYEDGEPDYSFSTVLDLGKNYRKVEFTIRMKESCIEDQSYPAREINGPPNDPNIDGVWETFKIFSQRLRNNLAKY